MTHKHILAHHSGLQGALILKRLSSRALGLRKPYFVYEPPGWQNISSLPVVYLFRGHEREYVNMREDNSRTRSTFIQDLDMLISRGKLPPMLAVMPGLNSSNNHVPSLGINMAGTWQAKMRGLGSGRFWDYLAHELIPRIGRDYAQTETGRKLMAGFSLGGYTVSLLAARVPGYFDDAGIYDGLFMWPGHADPRDGRKPFGDKIWCTGWMFEAALGKPRNRNALAFWNTTDMLLEMEDEGLAGLQKTRFYIASAPQDGSLGNKDRAQFLVKTLRGQKVKVDPRQRIFHADAAHNWHWHDRFMARFLMQAFG